MKINSQTLFKENACRRGGAGRAGAPGAPQSAPAFRDELTKLKSASPGIFDSFGKFRHGLGTCHGRCVPDWLRRDPGARGAGAVFALGPHARGPLGWALGGGRTDDGRGLVARGRRKGRPEPRRDVVPTASPGRSRSRSRKRAPRPPQAPPRAPALPGALGSSEDPLEDPSRGAARGAVLGAARGSGSGYWPGGPARGAGSGRGLGRGVCLELSEVLGWTGDGDSSLRQRLWKGMSKGNGLGKQARGI